MLESFKQQQEMSVLELYIEKDVAGGSMFHSANSLTSCGNYVSNDDTQPPTNMSNLNLDEDDDHDDDDYLVSNSYVEESLDEDDSVDGISDTDDEVIDIPQPVRIVHLAEGAQQIENPFWNDALHYNNINWSYPDEEDICGLEMPSTFNVGQELYVGMEFDSKDAVKNALKQYLMKVHQSFKVVESKSNNCKHRQFHRVFWTFGQCKEAFKYCNPIIQVDDTHLYDKYHGTLLMATSQDGNGGVLPLAFAVVEGETLTAWSWFLAHLREHVTDKNGICLISDRHASIKSAVANEALGWQPPHGYHVYCVRHIASNFNRKFNNAKQKEMLKKLEKFRELSPTIATWIDRISKEKWTMAYDREGRRYGHMTTNLSECINKVLKDCRNIPITALVKSTYSRCRKYFVERGRQAQRQLNEGKVYCSKLVKELRKKSRTSVFAHRLRVWHPLHKTLIPDLTTIRAKGWPKSTRIRNEMDWVEPSDHRQKCSRCGAEGHNRRRCPMQSERGSCSNH
ncbi:hypothetical protein GmHk_17G049095 [Glycine max]|nr:hypothetical protein GmHk_17G049095 [Glycine max]